MGSLSPSRGRASSRVFGCHAVSPSPSWRGLREGGIVHVRVGPERAARGSGFARCSPPAHFIRIVVVDSLTLVLARVEGQCSNPLVRQGEPFTLDGVF